MKNNPNNSANYSLYHVFTRCKHPPPFLRCWEWTNAQTLQHATKVFGFQRLKCFQNFYTHEKQQLLKNICVWDRKMHKCQLPWPISSFYCFLCFAANLKQFTWDWHTPKVEIGGGGTFTLGWFFCKLPDQSVFLLKQRCMHHTQEQKILDKTWRNYKYGLFYEGILRITSEENIQGLVFWRCIFWIFLKKCPYLVSYCDHLLLERQSVYSEKKIIRALSWLFLQNKITAVAEKQTES